LLSFSSATGSIDTSFNENALSENDRPGVHACDTRDAHWDTISKKILSAASGPPVDIRLNRN
jgi:hypothetical protein